MGNRACIITANGQPGIYLHWNGGRDSVEAFLTYCKMKGFRSPELDGYGWARMAQIIGNFFGGTLSIGIITADEESGKYDDNGAYIIRNWEIIGRRHFDGHEQRSYNLKEMLKAIDEAQPEPERLGEWLTAEEINREELQIGDPVIIMSNIDGKTEKHHVIGFGAAGKYVNGHDVTGIPYIDRYEGQDNADNINAYILTETARRPSEAEKPEEAPQDPTPGPVEIYINENLHGIELKFTAKPDDETREALKENGWKWHRKKAVWYAKQTPERLEMAQKIAGAVTG